MILLEDECGCIVVIVLVTFCILYVMWIVVTFRSHIILLGIER